nr:hypothetical protein [Fodinibius sp.]
DPGLKKRRAARERYEEVAKKEKPGEGGRFKALEAAAKASGAKDPGAVAAAIGRKKYGAKKFAEMGAKGRSRAAKMRSAKRKYK